MKIVINKVKVMPIPIENLLANSSPKAIIKRPKQTQYMIFPVNLHTATSSYCALSSSDIVLYPAIIPIPLPFDNTTAKMSSGIEIKIIAIPICIVAFS